MNYNCPIFSEIGDINSSFSLSLSLHKDEAMEGRYHPFRFPAEPVALHGPFAVRKHPLAFRAAAFQKCKNINMARLQLIQFSAKSASKKFFTFTSLSLLLHYDEASPQNQSPFMGQSPLVNTHKGFSRGILEKKKYINLA